MRKFWNTFFGEGVDFRVKLLNALALFGAVTSPIAAYMNYGVGSISGAVIMAFSTVLCAGLLWYVTKSRKFLFGSICMVILLGFVLWPMLSFSMGGFYGSMPQSFLCGIFITACLLRGRLMIILSISQLLFYLICCGIAYKFPQLVTPLSEVSATVCPVVAAEMTNGVAMIGITIILVLAWFFRLYDRQQESLEKANAKVTELSRVKSDLFSRINHEMRNPLSVMAICAETAAQNLKNAGDTDDVLLDLDAIRREALRLAKIAGSAMDTLSDNDVPIIVDTAAFTRVDIDAMTKYAVSLFKRIPSKSSKAPDGKINLLTDIAPAAKYVWGDESALMQVIWNPIMNAVAHSQCGTIRISAKNEGTAAVRLTIDDDGAGISPDLLPRVFEKGVSGGSSSGIGLYNCKDIVEKHGGKIEIDSTLGKGTTITVLLPAMQTEAKSEIQK